MLSKFANIKPLFKCLRQQYSFSSRRIPKSVYILESKDIYTNLAFEEWLHRNHYFINQDALMLWRNTPCVVIGRHQNPWLECNVEELPHISQGVKLARRNSGGGAVYHDLGCLNVTYFTGKSLSRKNNLELIASAIKNKYGINLNVSPNYDIFLGNAKVSGSAARIGKVNAYHHCTLLVETNKDHIQKALKSTIQIDTNATKSRRSNIINLKEVQPRISMESLVSTLIFAYTRSTDSVVINPTENLYPGLDEIRNSLTTWEWCYGKTPTFHISKICSTDIHTPACNFQLKISVEGGKISKVSVEGFPEVKQLNFNEFNSFKQNQFSLNFVDLLTLKAIDILKNYKT